jgi:hypothetical protein
MRPQSIRVSSTQTTRFYIYIQTPMLSNTDKKNIAKRKRLRKRGKLLNKFSTVIKEHDPRRYYLWNDPRENRREFLKCNRRDDSNNSVEA